MAVSDSLSSTFTGRVVSVNDRGLKLDGHTDWLNVSKFATGIVLPERGAEVRVTVDGKNFIRAIVAADGQPLLARVAGGSDAPAAPSSKDRTISRLAILKAAAEFGASRPELKSGDVLKIAESWERWVNRSDDELTDEAF